MTCAYFVHKLGVCHKKQQLNNIFNSLKKKYGQGRVWNSVWTHVDCMTKNEYLKAITTLRTFKVRVSSDLPR